VEQRKRESERERERERGREGARRDPLSTPLRRENICIVAALAPRIHPPVIAEEIVIFYGRKPLFKAREIPSNSP